MASYHQAPPMTSQCWSHLSMKSCAGPFTVVSSYGDGSAQQRHTIQWWLCSYKVWILSNVLLCFWHVRQTCFTATTTSDVKSQAASCPQTVLRQFLMSSSQS